MHLYLFAGGENIPLDKHQKEDTARIMISRKRNLGILNVDGKRVLVVDIAKTQTMRMTINYDYCNDAKRVYLNDVDIMDKIVPEPSSSPKIDAKSGVKFPAVFYFKDFGRKKSN